MLKELIDSVRDAGVQRLNNPLIGSYLVFLIILNWEVVMIVFFGDVGLVQRLELLRASDHTYVIPAIFAVSYVAILPWISWLLLCVPKRAIAWMRVSVIQQELDLAKLRQQLIEMRAKTEIAREREQWGLEKERRFEDRQDKEVELKHESLLQQERLMKEHDHFMDQMKLENDQLKNSLAKAEQQIQSVDSLNRKLEREKHELDSKLQSLNHDLRIQRGEAKTANTQNKKLQDQNSDYKAKNESFEREIGRLERQIEHLQPRTK